MPTKSSYPSVHIPDVDLWALMFECEREETFAQDQVIYRSLQPDRYYTFETVRSTAAEFGEALITQLSWEKGEVLSIFSANDVDIGPCTYGALYAGAIVSPANPSYSAEEFAFMLKDAGVKAIATQMTFLPVVLEATKLASIPEQHIILIGDDTGSPLKPDGGLMLTFNEMCRATRTKKPKGRRSVIPDKDLAFLVYSSGTTGLPKDVMLSHTNIVSDVLMVTACMGKYYSHRHDKFLGILPFYHIYGLTGLVHQPLYRGIELLVMPVFNLETFCRTIQDHKVTFVYVAPPVIVHLARSPIVDNFDLSSLKMITSGAAPLTQQLVDSVYARLQLKINQAYGLSETSPMTHTQPWEEWYSSVGSVGKMFPNMTAMYMSPEGKELGPGEVGELWLKGPNVFKGYWKRPDATKDAMSDNGYFKTGDVGFQDEKHNFYITDRVKELIKYNGFQVAPAELEGILMGNPEIDDVAVIGVGLVEEHTEAPRAYVVVAPGVSRNDATAKKISTWFDTKVAYYKKLRGGIRFVDEIPKSNSGKILRRVLKEQAKTDAASVKAKL